MDTDTANTFNHLQEPGDFSKALFEQVIGLGDVLISYFNVKRVCLFKH